MTAYIAETDITDSLLNGRVTREQITAANEFVDRLAASFGVVKVTVTPLAKKLAIAVACRDCCLSLVGTDATAMVGDRQEDAYAIKYKLYAQVVKDLQSQILKADFLADDEKNDEEEHGVWARTVSIYRS